MCFKFEQNRTINGIFDFFEERGSLKEGEPHLKIVIKIIIGIHIKCLFFFFKLQQNRTINEEFDFFER